MSYTHTTWANFKQALADRLYDSGKVFWLDAELGIYLREALRVWGATANYWREYTLATPTINVAFYDISAQTELARTVTNFDLITELEYHLLEPINTTGWSGSEQFSRADIVSALQNRLAELLRVSGIVNTHITTPVGPVSAGIILLPESTYAIRRISWATLDSTTYPLRETTETQLAALRRSWNLNASIPRAYTATSRTPYIIQVAPIPVDNGAVDMLVGRLVDDLTSTTEVTMGLPDDLTWVVKWGALADLLGRDGRAHDPLRAAYAEGRWAQGIEVAQNLPSIMSARINDQSLVMSTIDQLDSFKVSWQNTSGVPRHLATMGHNTYALYPVSDSSTAYSLTLDVVRNAPIPATDIAYVQVAREIIPVLLDYAQSIAMFKVGGEEFKLMAPAYDRLLQTAGEHNETFKVDADRGKDGDPKAREQ